jgi:hypothetical protein
MRSAEHVTWDVYMVTGRVRAGFFDPADLVAMVTAAFSPKDEPR